MKKRAILLGMNKYEPSTSVYAENLSSTLTDVDTLEKKLKQLDFETSSFIDCTLDDLRAAINNFAYEAPCDSVNIVYFSGHGGHSKGENYLYPVDFGVNLDKGLDITQSAFNVQTIPQMFAREVKLIIILDACRTNFTPTYGNNYSEIAAPKNTYIAYATKFDEPSLCTARISFFTETLCENILTPNISIDEMFISVRAALYLKFSKQVSNSVNGLMEPLILNRQVNEDEVGKAVVEFVDKYGDMYIDKYGCFAGDDLIFIDAAQYCDISVLDAIHKYLVLDRVRCHQETSLTEAHDKLIAFWGMLKHGLKQDPYYTWQYRGRPIRLGEIPPLPLDMQRPMPDDGRELEVTFSLKCVNKCIELNTTLPDKFKLYGQINGNVRFADVEVIDGIARIPLPDNIDDVHSLNVYSVLATISGVDMNLVGDKCRNLTGKCVVFNPINGNSIEYHYVK